MNQLNFSVRVRVRVSDSDRLIAEIKQREVMAILRSAFKGALRNRERDVTVWDSYGQLLAHFDADSTEKQTLKSCFEEPLGK